MKVAVVLGTRPEFIKMFPVLDALDGEFETFLIHTGQHYSYHMDGAFFRELKLPYPRYHLGVGSSPPGRQTGKMLIEIERVLIREEPDLVLVEGDTNTVLAGALAAAKLKIEVGHVEAGLRCFNPHMPEEMNRRLTDHLSRLLFAPTKRAWENLMNEGIEEYRIHVTGNTIVDAVQLFSERAPASMPPECSASEIKEFMLLTLHRQENVENRERLSCIFSGLELIHSYFQLPIVFPIHPRTEKMLKVFGLSPPEGSVTIHPLGFSEFLQLEKNARLVLTDSGGVQEESCILGTPCVTLRDDTERPETVEIGANLLAGTQPRAILAAAKLMAGKDNDWHQPFGDGQAGRRIIEVLKRYVSERGAAKTPHAVHRNLWMAVR